MAKIKLNDVVQKHVTIVAYLLISGLLGWISATFIVGNETLTIVFAPAINYVMYAFKKELDSEGVVQALKKQK